MSGLSMLKNGTVILLLQLLLHTNGQDQSRVCPPTTFSCNITSKYRSYDGSCNNLEHPDWGVSKSRYNRLLPVNYGDGESSLNLATDGSALPLAREVSLTVYPDLHVDDPIFTLITMQYGQILAHDMSLARSGSQIVNPTENCCSSDHKLQPNSENSSICSQINIPENDTTYTEMGIECLSFRRTATDLEMGCGDENQPVEQINQVNSYIDLSLTYGNDENRNKDVRESGTGKLKSEERSGSEWLPRSQNVTATCSVVNSSEPCYFAGDQRVNQNPQLTILQTILLREHNRIAETLAQLNPNWDNDRIFEEARKINIGQHQKIVYYDLLPHFLGRRRMLTRRLIYLRSGFVDDYNSSINPSVLNEHATASFRYFHTAIAGRLELVDEQRKVEDEVRISDFFNRPRILEAGNTTFIDLTRGLVTQRQYAVDQFHDKEITNNWRRQPGEAIGRDLKAVCIQRSRDHGLASYNSFREFCGLKRAEKFEDFLDLISPQHVQNLARLYKNPDDVDATVGGSLERHVLGTLFGPTFLCISTEQFLRSRKGDRFFFENSGDTAFTLPQLKEIRKASISRLICDNTEVQKMQPDGFLRVSLLNRLVSCQDLPSVNLNLWKE